MIAGKSLLVMKASKSLFVIIASKKPIRDENK
jgi:hypothetical protein